MSKSSLMILNNNRSLQYLLIFFFFLAINLPLYSNQGDWGLVQRFNKHLNSAQEGKVSAMYEVAKLFERGRGTNLNLARAAKWYEKASDAGNTPAKARLGIMYFEGRGVEQNYKKALTLLKEAVKANIPSAQYQLASMYERGTGVAQNLDKSLYWYKQAKKNGYYLADENVKRLNKLLRTNKSNSIPDSPVIANTKPTQIRPTKLLSTITNGVWYKKNKAVGYLPSKITNCVNDTFNSLQCISVSHKRRTTSEIINYNIKSYITLKDNKSFDIVYFNNVHDVTPLTIEDDDGNLIETVPSRIKKGPQSKNHKLSCKVKSKNKLSCLKDGRSFELKSR